MYKEKTSVQWKDLDASYHLHPFTDFHEYETSKFILVGQKSITNTLKNAIKDNQIAQSYLFCGPRGVGKTTCARIFAKEINQFKNDKKIDDFSFNIFELDACTN